MNKIVFVLLATNTLVKANRSDIIHTFNGAVAVELSDTAYCSRCKRFKLQEKIFLPIDVFFPFWYFQSINSLDTHHLLVDFKATYDSIQRPALY